MLKKLWTNRVGALIVMLCAFLLVFGFVSTADEPIAVIPADAEAESVYPTIILDAGHGGIDSGCVSINGVEEKDINLSIMLRLQGMLEAAGFDTIVTRSTDTSIHDPGITGLGNQKKSDMENRLAIVNSVENAIFISVHQNTYTDSKYSGAQMFYTVESSESAKLAGILQSSFVRYLQPDNERETKPVGSEIYLLHFANCPAVMAECGFLSNQEEADKLETEEYQSEVAFVLFSGICEYIFSDYGV
ncbi:MAG: N-acetylmuramoyl-L-alanine amidase [Oscillospiraceae bacterium]|nr:N-acetylmuramoyl-L-alanine amidase [Oscillospiraceae bacterium]